MDNKIVVIGNIYHNELEGVDYGDVSIDEGKDLTDVLLEMEPHTKVKITIEVLSD